MFGFAHRRSMAFHLFQSSNHTDYHFLKLDQGKTIYGSQIQFGVRDFQFLFLTILQNVQHFIAEWFFVVVVVIICKFEKHKERDKSLFGRFRSFNLKWWNLSRSYAVSIRQLGFPSFFCVRETRGTVEKDTISPIMALFLLELRKMIFLCVFSSLFSYWKIASEILKIRHRFGFAF